MTPLGQAIARRIAAAGPITVADYMAECLLHPTLGYYSTRDPLGVAGDFTTAPEISQMFGELLGLCLAQTWMDQGAPARALLAELGPGRGTLMADILRAARAVPSFRATVEVHLVEASPVLRTRQAEALAGVGATWHDRVDALPEGPLFLVANEFFDALPIRQFLRDGGGWCERVIGLDEKGGLSFGLTTPAPVAALAHRLADTRDGDLVEFCPAAAPIAGEVGRRIAAHGGAALIVDYGGARSLGDTFQAVRGHAFADPLAEPGLADLTAHVDFGALAAAAAPAIATELVPQGVLLERLGIGARAAALAARLDGEARARHLAAWHRLTDPAEMGTVFKTIAFHPRTHPAPPGFA
jgi:NADH dehydrogenase [ubiquinone] 1 alpha subcomplex assembly factor 7